MLPTYVSRGPDKNHLYMNRQRYTETLKFYFVQLGLRPKYNKLYTQNFHSLTHNKILNWSKLKVYEDMELNGTRK